MNKLKILALVGLLASCSWFESTEENLTTEDMAFLTELCYLDSNETILQFDSNGGLSGIEQSGNFFTNEAVYSYWREDNIYNKYGAFYPEIDSIQYFDKVTAITLSSYATVFHDSSCFNVYIDADKERTWQFFDSLEATWQRNRN